MNAMKGALATAIVLSAAGPSFAGRHQMESAVENLEQAASAQDALGAVYDNSAPAAGGTSSQAVAAGRPSLDAPRIAPVDHRYRTGSVKSKNSAERGFDWMMHPASEIMSYYRPPFPQSGLSMHPLEAIIKYSTENPFLFFAGLLVGAVLLVPAIIAGAVNAVIGL